MKFNIEVELDWLEEASLDDEIRSEIVSEASKRLLNIVNEKVEGIGKEAVDTAHKQVDALIADYMKDFINQEVTITDDWGSVKRKGTIETLIKDRIKASFTQKVDRDGRPDSSSYSNMTIVEYYTQKYADNLVKKEFERLRKEIDKSIEDAIRNNAKELLSGTLLKQIDLSAVIEAAKFSALGE